MPFTPFHLGPGVLVGLVLFRRLDVPTLLVASVVVDVRAALVLFGFLDGPLHGAPTTFAGGALVAGVLASVAYPFRPGVDRLLEGLRLRQPRSGTRIVAAALLGVWLHVVLDALLYADVQPFAPVTAANPFLGLVSPVAVYVGCVVTGLIGAGVYALSRSGVAVPGLAVDEVFEG